MSDNETIADLIAWMKELSAMKRDAVFNAPVCYSCGTTIAEADLLDELIPKLEAANNRECGELVTGSNQLREALVKARRFIDSSPLVSIEDNTGTIARGELCAEIDAVLADPVRNCDRFATLDEARAAHEAICEKYVKCHNGCPLNNEEHYSAFDCFEAWLFAPATEKEGGAK